MKDYKKYFRTLEKVEEDLLLPFLGLGEQPGTEVRMAAMTEVLRRIPEEDYEILKRKKSTVDFQWFIRRKIFSHIFNPFSFYLRLKSQKNFVSFFIKHKFNYRLIAHCKWVRKEVI